MTTGKVVIELEEVNKWFGDFHVLKDIDLTVADEMVFMDEGRIVESASPEKFFASPESDRTKVFLSQILSH